MNIQMITNLTYQCARKYITKKMNDDEVVILKELLEEHLIYMYNSISLYGKGESSKVVVSEREYHIMMKGVKKLEIVYGYATDRINKTNYTSLYKNVDKKLKVC